MRIEARSSLAGAGAAPTEVPARRTPTSMGDIRAAIARALESQTGAAASSRTVDVLAAQASLETGHGQAMYNFNFGGIKGAGPTGQTANYLTHEVLNGRDVTVEQGFRAYGSLDDGARDYIGVLRARFPQAYAQAVSGNVDGFAHALKQSHYYTAPEESYAAGLRAAANAPAAAAAHGAGPAALLPAPAAPADSSLATSAELSRVLDAIAASAARIAEPDPKE